MMKTNSSQQRMKDKARAAMEPGLVSKTPQVAVKKSNEMRMRNEIAKERPIGLKNGGAVRRYAEGGSVKKSEREVIEFSGKELDDIMGGETSPQKIKSGEKRGMAAERAFWNQKHKGKSHDAARDAGDVIGSAKYAKGGAVHSEKGEKKADVAQDKAMIARHNRLMHPGQKSKLAKGGAAKYAAGGAAKVRLGVATPKGAPKPQPRNKNPAYR